MKSLVILFTVFSVAFGIELKAQIPQYPAQEVPEIGIYEHLDEYVPDDVFLYDKDSNRVNVRSLIDKTTIFSFVYFNCPGLCSPLLDGLAEVIGRSDLELGKDYQVITISFNPEDNPSLGIQKKSNYVAQIERPVDASQWIWLTGDSASIAQITDALGFKYKKEGKEFVHAASIMVVSPKGKITRYLHGTYFLPFDLKMAIIEAQSEISSPTINKVLKYCFSYDAEGKKYVFNVTKISGTVILAGAFMFLLVLIMKRKPENQQINKQ
jgi:protein SCO1/2